MVKKCKKMIACLLAVLMVAVSVPFSALAAPGDYKPDIELMFFPVWMDGGWGNYDDIVGAKGKDVSYHISDGAGDVALDYDVENGTLTLSASKAATYLELNETAVADTILADGDYTLGAGDYFAATVVCKNISTLYAVSTAISHSGNIVPAGVYVTQEGSGTRRVQTAHMAAVSDFDASAVSTAGPYFDDFSGTLYGLDTEMNEIDANGNMFVACAGEEPYSDVSAVDADTAAGFMNPKTGAEGWDAAGTAILGTFIFKIVDDTTPITFEAADPDNQIYAQYAGGLYLASVDDGIAVPRDITTVAGGTHAGAGKMTYFKDWAPPEPEKYIVIYQDEEGNELSREEVAENKAPAAVPTLPTSNDKHVTYAWDGDTTAAVTANITFKIVKTVTEHSWSDWEERAPAGCLTTGTAARTCSICEKEETKTIAALGHDYQFVVTEPTCTEAGYTTATCSRCGDTYTEDGDPATDHAWGAWEETTPATCTAKGEKKRTCSRCDAFETAEIEALGHDYGEWAETTPATCTAKGEKKRTCSRCDAFETAEIDALGHDYKPVVTPATCTAGGYTTYTCSRCQDSYTGDEKAALGHDLGEWKVTTPATTSAAGEETRTCSRCDYKETREIPKVVDPGVAPEPTDEEIKDAPVDKKLNLKAAKIKSTSNFKKKTMTITFAAVKGATNYQVRVRKAGAKKWTQAFTNNKTSYVVKKVAEGSLYEFQIRAMKKDGDKWLVSAWSNVSRRYIKKTAGVKATPSKTSAKITWKKDKKASGYEVTVYTDKTCKKKVASKTLKGAKKTSATFKKLKKNKTYYYRIRSYKTKNGKKYLGILTTVKSFKTKK